MTRNVFATLFLVNEAESLLTRLNTVKPFAFTMPMVPAAQVSDESLKGITDLIIRGNRELKGRVGRFIKWLKSPASRYATEEEAQGRFALLKLRFNALLDQLDIFADVISQRAEYQTGVWVAGLDVLAADALQLEGGYYKAPPLICFLERGHGAAIRRARTRLPSGELNPVAVIQVPRERMVGSGIASSLIHEVGHQGAALLGLIDSLRIDIRQAQAKSRYKTAWDLYYRWISEIIADFWAMAHLGISATLGLMNVVSLPRYFMFRIKLDDPHPFPWIRVKLSLAFGRALYPHAQWDQFETLWHRMYSTEKLDNNSQQVIAELIQAIPEFVQLLLNHRSESLRGNRLAEVFPYRNRQPARLQQLFQSWRFEPEQMSTAPPSLIFAVIGQAHADTTISASDENKVLSQWLSRWAFLRSENRTMKASRQVINEIKHLLND